MNNFHMREGKVEFRWKRWRNKKRQEVSSCLMVLFSGAVLLGAGGVALAGPTGGQVTGGQGTITNPNGTTTNINQQSNVLTINWQDFSIQQGETVNFYQPGSTSVAINRVVGGVPSYLAGALNANGRVFILNSAGITFTGTSQVNVGALLATTAMTVNGDPTQAASYSGSGYGAVINQGSISVSNGGFAILAAPYVQNTGFIKADLGTIALAGTNQFTLDLSGTGLINFVVPAGAVEKIVSDGKAVGVDNSGSLQARSGQVLISASVASEVINAVVNLNGIVDADAFAANGQGGSVLVTAAGDVNVGGTVTARGNGTGNGGQIVTKAVGDDTIGSMAFVSATGGASGAKGGFVEVSGKQVGLGGNIDPGKGGSVYIDPQNITVIAGTAGGPAGTHIGSDFIENQLAHGINVTLDACHNITFQALADDHQLVGGSGNFDIVAGDGSGGNIAFLGANDAIVQGSGFIHMNANGGNIGSSGHAMTLITGVNNTNAGQGVTQAGDIVLKAGNDIHVHNVQVKSSGGSSFTAKFSASAGHNFVASGDINVTAIAHGNGHQQATASVNIFAHNNINVQNVAVTALANNASFDGGGDASANALLQLNAQTGNVQTRNLTVDASALSLADNEVTGTAFANIQANGNIDITGGVNVAAVAVSDNPSDNNSSVFANGNLLMNALTGHVNVTQDVTVGALAKQRNSSADATASALINANTLVMINGNVGVTATASGENVNAANDFAFANLVLDAAAGDVVVNHDIEVSAAAHGFGTGLSSNANATAEATANIVGNNINVAGNVIVTANAVQSGDHDSSSAANALANLLMNAATGHVNVGHDVVVNVFARQMGTSLASANAQANIVANTDITINGNVDVTASVDNLGSLTTDASACANLTLNAIGGNIVVNHDIDVEAFAHSHGTGEATGNAVASIFANNNITINGNVEVEAFGNNPNANASSATACASLVMDASHGALKINHDVIVKATATSGGTSSVRANVAANLFANTDVVIGGNVEVTANGQQSAAKGSDATACANLQIDASHGSVNVGGNIDVAAIAHSAGVSSAIANAQANIFANTHIHIGGDVTVSASAEQDRSNGSEARACANLLMSAATGSVNVLGDITANAKALAQGTESAHANAKINIFANGDIDVGGNVDAYASANQNGTTGTSAHACANVNLHPDGDVNVNGGVLASANAFSKGSESGVANAAVHINILGDITVNGIVTANAHAIADSTDAGGSNNGALALASIDVNGDPVILGGVDEHATATSHGSVNKANAQANAFVHGASNLSILGDVTVAAKALDDSLVNGQGAEANAQADIAAGNNLTVGGNVHVTATANALDSSGSNVNALANLTMNAHSGNLHINHGVMVNAIAHDGGTGSPRANALANLYAQNDVVVGNVVAVLASVNHDSDTQGARAFANLQVLANSRNVSLGGIDVTAIAHSGGSSSAHANALANVVAHNNLAITGNASVSASADQTGSNGTTAYANANLQLNAVTGSINLARNVDVVANAHAAGNDGTNSAAANALGNIVANTNIHIGGVVSVSANADQIASNGGGGARANANLQVDAITGSANLGGIDVRAVAFGSDGSSARAIALANVLGNTNVHIANNAVVFASAVQNAADGSSALATADLLLNGVTGSVNIVHNVLVEADAFDNGSSFAQAAASANIHGNTKVVISGGSIEVTANALQNGAQGTAANANATLTVTGGVVVLGSDDQPFDDDTTFGPVGAHAHAVAKGLISQAKALANVHIDAVTGNASIFGTLEGIATASYAHAGGQALNNTIASGLVHVNAADNIVVEEINLQAIADNHANKSAVALASLNLNAAGSIQLEDKQTIAATADNFSANGASGGGTIGASANAQAHLNGTTIVAPESSQSIDVRAHALNAGHNAAKAVALLDFGAATQVNIGGITLDVLSSETRVNDNGIGASANAVLTQTNGGAHWIIGDHGLNVQAVAHSHGNAFANAHASVNIVQNTIEIDGPVTVNAEADAGSNAVHGAQAVANLFLNASTGALSVGEGPFGTEGSIFVRANAYNLGHNHADALADVSLLGNAAGHNAVYAENIVVEAFAFDNQANGAADTKANAQFLASADNGSVDIESLTVVACADLVHGTAGGGAHAIANAAVIGNSFASAEGGIAVVALALDPGGAYACATADLLFSANGVFIGNATNEQQLFSSGTTHINLSANYGVLVGAVAIFSNSLGAGHAQADANANIVADVGAVTIDGAADVAAIAVDQGGVSANADADLQVNANTFVDIHSGSLHLKIANDSGTFASLSVEEGVFVAAAAIDTGNGHVDAGADASIQANQNNITVGGIDEFALGFASNGTHANAQAHLLVNAGDNVHITGGSVSLNFFGSQFFLGSLIGGAAGSSIAILQAAIAIDGGAGASHHANALASANIDPNLVQINGDVIVAAAAFDNSGHGATANANLFIHANEVHIGTSQGSANIIVAAIAQDSGLIPAAVNAQANANILANGASTDAISINDVTVFAFANAEAVGGLSTVIANAHLFMSANNGGVRVGSINVAAVAIAEDTNGRDAQANASANVQANREIFVNGDISVTASASDTATDAGDANAFALLVLNAPNGSIDVEGTIFVGANAYENGGGSALANATASIQAERVTLNGGVDVEAQANLANAAGTSALACANLDIDAFSGSININGPVTVNAQASGNGTGNASAYALAEIDANGGNVRVSGSIDVTANALLDGGQGDGAHANANLFIDAAFGGTEDIALTGNITVNAQAQGNGTHGGGSGDSVTANAQAHIGGTSSAQHVDVDINGNIEVTANADYSGGDGQNAWACANLEINATSGYVNLHGNVAVNAVALSNGTESALANAEAEISAENGAGSNAGDIFVVGNISVTANAAEENSTAWGAHACANLNIIAHSGDVSLIGNLRSNAHAVGNGSNSSASVTANAVMQLETNSGNVSVNGFIAVTALASYTGDDDQDARACASLDVDASSGNLGINGAVNVVASAVDHGAGTASANATAELAAENGGPGSSAGNVTINGNIRVKGNAQQLSGSGGNAFAQAELDIDADSGGIFINGAITMNASAHDEGFGNASAFANVDIDALHNISVTGDIGAFANATHLGSNSGNASAEATVSVNTRNNVSLRGVVAIADADVPDTSASHSANAIATANIGVKAGSNISIGPDGLFADADASAFSGGHASANAQIAVDAGTNGVGNLFIRGNVIAIAVALGSATGNTAHANAHMAAGGASELSTGAPSNFGNITVIGNIGAFAAADATSDQATASVEMFAHNNIVIVGNAPIASAVVGAGGGTVFAFRQANFTTNQFASGPGGNATADIDIRAGGFVAVFPASSLTHVEKLYAMPTDTPTLNSSGGLTIIPLAVDGQDCGVLGVAGMDQNAINKTLSCHRKPINVSDLTDTGP